MSSFGSPTFFNPQSSALFTQEILNGGVDICREAGIPLAGGHSIDSPEPIFGLVVTGRVVLKMFNS
jgi:selenophosphate synthase